MSRTHTLYSEEFRLSVLRDYYSSGMSMNACARKHGISHAILWRWKKQAENEKELVSLQAETASDDDMPNRSKDSYREEIAALGRRNRELEKALEISRMETRVRDMMIDKAEEYFDIPIRKKSGAR
ncbi:MAG: transposase [Prevotella sp.]